MSKKDPWKLEQSNDVWRLAHHLAARADSVDFGTELEDDNQDAIDTFYAKCMDDLPFFAPRCLFIKGKDAERHNFEFNRAQWYLHTITEWMIHKYGYARIIVVKGRQQGISTYLEGRAYWRVIHRENYNVLIMTHEMAATNNLFDMSKRYHEFCPEDLQPALSASNGKVLKFGELDSQYLVATAGAGGAGRSQTAHYFHACLSEGTQVLDATTGTLRPIETFSVGDMVRTHSGAVAPISYVSTKHAALTRLKVKGYPEIFATPQHKFVTPEGKRQLMDLKAGDVILHPVATIDGPDEVRAYRLPDSVRPQGGGTRETGPDAVTLGYKQGRVVGLYLAEGSAGKNRVVFSVHEKEVSRTLDWLRLGFPDCFRSLRVGENKGTLTRHVEVNSRSFRHFLVQLAGRKDSKHVPEGSAEFCRGMLHGYLAGDGHYDVKARRIVAPSIRSAISTGMRDVAASLGYGWAGINYREGAVRNGRNEQAQWTFALSGSGVDMLAKEVWGAEPNRRRTGSYGETQVIDGFAHVQVTAVEPAGIGRVYDFEVDHPDHSYCLAGVASSNSEVAFWPDAAEHASGILQAIGLVPGTEVFMESTADGIANYFYEMWQSAEPPREEMSVDGNGYVRVFIPWFWEPGYTMEAPEDFKLTEEETQYAYMHDLDVDQMFWRRRKIGEMDNDPNRFKRDYPATPEEAFEASGDAILIRSDLVAMARRRGKDRTYQAIGSVVMGVDVARQGDDATAFVIRQGRVILHRERMVGAGAHLVAGRLLQLKSQFGVDHTFLDGTGGYGTAVYDVLADRGKEADTTCVHFSSAADEPERFNNVRTEMWWRVREWMLAGAAVTDDPDWGRDLCAPQYKYQRDMIALESKDDIKKRIKRSPDVGDALALTFRFPVQAGGQGGYHEPNVI